MAFLADYALKDIRKISFTSVDGTHKATIKNVKSGSFVNGIETIWATGMNGERLASFSSGENVTFTAQSGSISDSAFLLNGANVEVKTNTTGYQVEEVVLVGTGGTSITLTHKAAGTVGSEIGTIYVCDEKGNVDTELSYEQATTASATEFSYAAETKVITLPTGAFVAGHYVLVKYFPTFSSLKEISRAVGAEPFEGEVRIFLFVTRLKDKVIDNGQIYIPRGRLSGNYEFAFGDAAAVQDINIDVQAPYADAGKYWYFYIGNESDIVDA